MLQRDYNNACSVWYVGWLFYTNMVVIFSRTTFSVENLEKYCLLKIFNFTKIYTIVDKVSKKLTLFFSNSDHIFCV